MCGAVQIEMRVQTHVMLLTPLVYVRGAIWVLVRGQFQRHAKLSLSDTHAHKLFPFPCPLKGDGRLLLHHASQVMKRKTMC